MSQSLMAQEPCCSAVEAVETNGSERRYRARFDVWETDSEWTLYGELPGVSPEDLEIRFENGELTVHGKVKPRQEGIRHIYGEYGVGDFYRSFAVGEQIDSERISAELKRGVLVLQLPKTESAKTRRIQVKGQ